MHHTLDHLEPRSLLAQSTPALTDADGDTFTIKLTGPGSYTLNTTPGADFVISAIIVNNDTTAASKLSINVTKKNGDGRVRFNTIIAQGALGALSAAKVDIAQFGLVATQAVGTLAIGDLSASVGATTGAVKSATFRNLAASSNIQLGGTSANTTALTLGDVASNASGLVLRSDSAIGKFTAGQLFGNINLTAGLKDLLIAKASSCQFAVVGGAAPVNSIVSKAGLELIGDFAQRVNTISAQALHFDATFIDGVGTITTTLGGITGGFQTTRIGKMTAKTSISGFYTANSWGTISGASITNATIRYSSVGPSGFVIDAIKAGAVTSTSVLNDAGIVGNLRIKSIGVASWSGGTIQADALDTLTVKGDFNAIVDLFNGAGQPTSIKSATIGGDLSGEFRLASVLTSLKAASTGAGNDTFAILKANNPVVITKLELTGAGPSYITVFSKNIGTFKAKGSLFGTLNISEFNNAAIGLASLSARELSVTINAANSGIGSITTKRLHNFEINAAFVKSVAVTAGSGFSGNVENGFLTLSNANTDGLSLKSFSAKGSMFNALVRTASSIGTFSVNTFSLCGLYAGLATNAVNFPETLDGFDPAARIGSFTVKAPFSNASSFANSTIVAATIDKVLINGRIDTSGSVVGLFGFGARTFGTLSVRDLNGVVVKQSIPVAPNDYQWFASSDNFRIRVYA